MTIDQLGSIVTACIVSAGGIGGIVIAVVKFSSDMIASRLSAKYESKLQKEMEKFKTELNKKEYVSKARFDTELGIYRELSQTFCTMVKDISVMIPAGFSWRPAGEEAQKKYEDNCYEVATDSVVKAQDALYANAAFIPQQFFESFEEILKLCKQQLNVFAFRYNVLSLETEKEKRSLSMEDYKRTEEINKKWIEHINRIREYLASLDVI